MFWGEISIFLIEPWGEKDDETVPMCRRAAAGIGRVHAREP